MKIALISIVEDCLNPLEGPRGLTMIGPQSLAAYQAGQALEIGCEKLIFAVQAMHGAMLALADDYLKKGIDVEVIRSPLELESHVHMNDVLLVIRDGLYFDSTILEQFADHQTEIVAIIGNEADVSGFERIDLNHRWAGIALVSGRHIPSISQLPDDWSIESALLRQAVQAECERIDIDEKLLLDASLVEIASADQAVDVSTSLLKSFDGPSPSFVERFVHRPISKLLLPYLWKHKKAKAITAGLTIAPAIVAVVGAATSFAMTATTALFLGHIFMSIHDKLEPGNKTKEQYSPVKTSYFLAAIGALFGLIYSSDASSFSILMLSLGTAISGLQYLIGRGRKIGVWGSLRPGYVFALFTLSISSVYGLLGEGMSIVILASVASLVIDDLIREKAAKTT